MTNNFDDFNLAGEIATQQFSSDEKQIALFLSPSGIKNNVRIIDVSNRPTNDIEGKGDFKLDNSV